uniref:CobQ/CobB/MinD/ParA nucleotide binding domain-containing protein n=1 Tax=Candidatus Kentrum sp. TUN TaxID=2126343 RepID=A0A450ZYQ8_9GAMM|nr:MAG: CobQ/CobB/MinD/ParA nucleotide binding domain-containing protein [Candidatus Kentron sp. TUN]VFK67915.1 MAG: CobQ/CobB/MinD/ParA nucleotide binding domain-containing protein [Candidatus Kentron sp. TUN]
MVNSGESFRDDKIMKYAIWNNKGGVGKTFLSFILGTEYAKSNPEKKVILVDMCPQANLSKIVLGGNGKGGNVLSKILRKNERKTIGGYFDFRIRIPSNLVGVESEYLTTVNEFNKELPKNLYLICGDPSLEFQAQVINQISSQSAPDNIWRNVRYWLNDLLKSCSTKLGSELTIIIDCNPSFSSYTEIALAASDRLIMPCSSDGSSARAIDNVTGLLYGFNTQKGYKRGSFSVNANDFGMALPLIHTVIHNRFTPYAEEASKSFKAMFGEIKNRVENFKNNCPDKFAGGVELFSEMPDTHRVTIACSHKGIPLYKLSAKKYMIHNEYVAVTQEQLDGYRAATNKLLETIT